MATQKNPQDSMSKTSAGMFFSASAVKAFDEQESTDVVSEQLSQEESFSDGSQPSENEWDQDFDVKKYWGTPIGQSAVGWAYWISNEDDEMQHPPKPIWKTFIMEKLNAVSPPGACFPTANVQTSEDLVGSQIDLVGGETQTEDAEP